MELIICIILGFMIIGAIFALHARDLLSALVAQGIVGYGLVICFLLLKAPDLAIVQIVVETITLIIIVAVILNTTRKEIDAKFTSRSFIKFLFAAVFIIFMMHFFNLAIQPLEVFGQHTMRMAEAYVNNAHLKTGSANLVTGVLFDFRGYDTIGEATILFTAAVGVITVLRLKGKKL